jgi:hypothetical protein
MSLKRNEQIDRHESVGAKRVMKKRTKRLRRAQERVNVEEAPIKNRYRGYTS